MVRKQMNNKKYNSYLVICLFVLISLMLGGDVSAQGRRLKKQLDNEDSPKGLVKSLGGGGQMRVWARALKMTNSQVRQWRQIMRASVEQVFDVDDELRSKRKELELAIFSETLNEEQVKQLVSEIGKLESQKLMLKTKVKLRMRQVLTSEQLHTYNELRFGLNSDIEEDKPVLTPPEQKK